MAVPPVILIGGASGTGKSTLGRALAGRLGYSSLSGDDLQTAAFALTSPGSHPEFHQARGKGHLEYFTKGPKEKLIADSEARETTMWAVVVRVVSDHLDSGEPVVIDWWLLRPSVVASLGDARVGSVWLYVEPDELWARERRNEEWTRGSADPQRMLSNFMHRSLWRNELVKDEAKRLGLPILRTTGAESSDELVDRAMSILQDSLAE